MIHRRIFLIAFALVASSSFGAVNFNFRFSGTPIDYNPNDSAAGSVGTGAIFQNINFDIGQVAGGSQTNSLIDGKQLSALAVITKIGAGATVGYGSATDLGQVNGFSVNTDNQALQFNVAGNGDVFVEFNLKFGFYENGEFTARSFTEQETAGLTLQVFDIDSIGADNSLSDVFGYIPSQFGGASLSTSTQLQKTAAGQYTEFNTAGIANTFAAVDLIDSSPVPNIGFGDLVNQPDYTIELNPIAIPAAGLDFAWGFRDEDPDVENEATRAFLLLGQNPPLVSSVPEPSTIAYLLGFLGALALRRRVSRA